MNCFYHLMTTLGLPRFKTMDLQSARDKKNVTEEARSTFLVLIENQETLYATRQLTRLVCRTS